ncbi:MAG: hypothetical protein ABSH20_00080 [Tepidisphaeraceae bacterium]|jgi:hypothetical protein
MLTSSAATLKFVTNVDPRVRQGAFELLSDHWKPDVDLEDVYKRTALTDPDRGVQRASLNCLITLHRGSKKHDVCEFCAQIAKDNNMTEDMRSLAYLGLLEIQQSSLALDYAVEYAQTHGKMLRNVDWAMVESFLNGNEDPGRQ